MAQDLSRHGMGHGAGFVMVWTAQWQLTWWYFILQKVL
jgi:hypothetical protein